MDFRPGKRIFRDRVLVSVACLPLSVDGGGVGPFILSADDLEAEGDELTLRFLVTSRLSREDGGLYPLSSWLIACGYITIKSGYCTAGT